MTILATLEGIVIVAFILYGAYVYSVIRTDGWKAGFYVSPFGLYWKYKMWRERDDEVNS